ncbi:MAG TPA: hypothetical protein VH418_09180, partial [Solirubrobacteraceae bacterium]
MSLITRSYPSLDAFYDANRRRRRSRERDVGLIWRGAGGATFRAAWVQETGEVYLFKHGHPLDGGGTVSVLDRHFGLGELQRALSGYRDVVGRAGSLVWFLERVAQPTFVAGSPSAAAARR